MYPSDDWQIVSPPAETSIASRRWRVSVYKNTFVIEPNPRAWGLAVTSDVPNLLIFRNSDAVAEVPSRGHDMHSRFGRLECLLHVEAILGILVIEAHRFLCLAAESALVASFNSSEEDGPHVPRGPDHPTPPPHASRKRNVYSVLRSLLLHYETPVGLGNPDFDEGLDITGPVTSFGEGGDLSQYASLIQWKNNIEKMLATSGFYFSYDMDITHTLQRKHEVNIQDVPQSMPCPEFLQPRPKSSPSVPFISIADQRFFWNRRLCAPLLTWGADPRWLVPLVQGSVSVAKLCHKNGAMTLALLCRRSCRRGGTRYKARGLDKKGNVANFCESEQLIHLTKTGSSETKAQGWASLVQIRGSVPLFWEQSPGLQLNPKPNVISLKSKMTSDAFFMHQNEIHALYNNTYYINLLSQTKHGEPRLAAGLEHLENIWKGPKPQSTPMFRIIPWDFHMQTKQRGFEQALHDFVGTLVEESNACGYFAQGAFWLSAESEGKAGKSDVPIQKQVGIFRTNCMDCLDRTNAFQWYYCWTWVHNVLMERRLQRYFLISGYKRSFLPRPPSEPSLVTHHPKTTNSRAPSPSPGGARHDAFWDTGNPPRSENVASVSYVSPIGETMELHYEAATATTLMNPGAPQGPSALDTIQGDRLDALRTGGDPFVPCILKDIIAQMWADHGDRISAQYTGTGSVLSAVIKQGKSSMATNVDHWKRSFGRLYQNTFEDSSRQEAIEMFLYQHRTSPPMPDAASLPLYLHDQTPAPQTLPSAVPLATAPSPEADANLGVESEKALREVETQDEQAKISDALFNVLFKSSDDSTDDIGALGGGDVSSLSYETIKEDAMRRRGAEGSTPSAPKKLTAWVGTWNVGAKVPLEEFTGWMQPASLRNSHDFDMYIVCVQELVELTSVRVLMNAGDEEREAAIDAAARRVLGSQYIKLKSWALVGMYMTIFVKVSLVKSVGEVDVCDSKAGFRGAIGNKGAIAIRLKIYGGSICFICGHFPSGKTRTTERRELMAALMQQCFENRPTMTIRQQDVIILAGDLNFRVMMEDNDVLESLASKNITTLLEKDELNLLRKHQVYPFSQFLERPFHYLPTYKFQRGSSKYDRTRAPAWCDRVLWADKDSRIRGTAHPRLSPQKPVRDSPKVQCVAYDSLLKYNSSDHKPVYAVMEIDFTPEERRLSAPPPPPPAPTPTETSPADANFQRASDQISWHGASSREGSRDNAANTAFSLLD